MYMYQTLCYTSCTTLDSTGTLYACDGSGGSDDPGGGGGCCDGSGESDDPGAVGGCCDGSGGSDDPGGSWSEDPKTIYTKINSLHRISIRVHKSKINSLHRISIRVLKLYD